MGKGEDVSMCNELNKPPDVKAISTDTVYLEIILIAGIVGAAYFNAAIKIFGGA
jgi:hypothetical protein